MKKLILTILSIAALVQPMSAQRTADKLDRGLIAVPATGGGTLVSWRLLGEEYYDVVYNVYRDGTRIASNLEVTNYVDKSGTSSSQYTVSAVVNGVEQPQCNPIKRWSSTYKEIKLTHEGIKSTLVPNDACCADVDGDGELEILMKFDNESEIAQSFPKNGPVVNGVTTYEYSIFEVFKLDGTRLWWVNCGPNMGDFQNNEQNIVAYDWDGDGKAEAVMRAADGTTIHMADGTTYTVGNASLNYRGATGGGANWFMCQGNEYLVYMNGETGKPYQCITYPLLRLESGETNLNNAWGDGTGHRCSKFFFGAPYLDGRKPSIFLARGIYTRHKMIALDVNPTDHTLVQRWRWDNNTNGAWKGQGYHNYSIADVDEDGRDEIVYGSMVIDDNGKGLSTTGYGHGDAQHCADLNPYAKGLETFCCNEDEQGFNYRDATTSKIYAQTLRVGKDVGRAMAGNFTNEFPGGLGTAWGVISTVTNAAVDGLEATGVNANFRIYWDGDLCSETFNYLNGKNTEGCVAKYGSWSPIYTCEGSMTNNDTKGTPCYQGDVLGDWREEIIMRDGNNNVRIYTTPVSTTYRIPTLWADHQYRNAMVWQMCGYNQPPHLSYFLGQLEGITMAPPPLTMNGRVEVANGGKVDASLNGKHAIVCETNNTQVSLAEGVSPSVLTFNVPSWVQGTAASNASSKDTKINYAYYTCTVGEGSLSGNARLVKQGDGTLNLPATEFTHTGETRVWGGTLNFDGKMSQSSLWMNRFTTLNSNGAFKDLTALYASTIRPGGENKVGTLTADSVFFGFGSRWVVDIQDGQCDKIKAHVLYAERKTSSVWVNAGPEYLQPIIEIKGSNLQAGDYVIAECDKMATSVTNFKLAEVDGYKAGLKYEGGKLILTLGSTRGASQITWNGAKSAVWDYATTENFTCDGAADVFVNGDLVQFGDQANAFSLTLNENLSVDTMRFVNENKNYVLNGDGAIVKGAYVKQGKGKVTINTLNSYTGGNFLRSGTTVVSALSNSINETGNLGGIVNSGTKFTFENGAVLESTAAVTNGSPIKMIGTEGGVIDNSADFVQEKAIVGTVLTKKGAGCLKTKVTNNYLERLVVAGGSLAPQANNPAKVVELRNGAILYDDAQSTSHEIYVPAGASASWHLTYTYYTVYANKVTGEGTLTIVPRNTVQRVRITGDWSQFKGTIKHNTSQVLPLDCSTGLPNGTLDIASGCTATNVCKTFTIGKMAGAGALGYPIADFKSQAAVSGSNTWRIGNSWENGDFDWSGTLTDAKGSNKANFEKIGSCTMTVKGAWTNSGTVIIKEGTLKANSGACLGTGALTVNAGARLMGNIGKGKDLTNASYTIHGTLQPILVENYAMGTYYFGGKNVTLSQTSELRMCISKASTSATMMSGTSIANIGTLTLNGKIYITIQGTNYVPKAGDQIRLWTGVTTVQGTPTVEIEGYTCEFDLSHLSEGYVQVTSATGIGEIAAEEEIDSSIYNLNGQRMDDARQLPAGIYIRNHKKIIVR